MKRLTKLILGLLLDITGCLAAIFFVWNSFDSQGIDAWGFVPGIICAVALGANVREKLRTWF
jgi:hypothetical protein